MTYPYWIEHDENGNAINNLWIKVDSIPAGGDKVIYISKGDGAPDGDSVFEFFDDFDGSSLDTSKWGTIGGESDKYTILVSDSKLNIYISDSDWTGAYIISANEVKFGNGYAVKSLMMMTDFYTSAQGFGVGFTNSSPTIDTAYYFVPTYPIIYSKLYDYIGNSWYLSIFYRVDETIYNSDKLVDPSPQPTVRNNWYFVESKLIDFSWQSYFYEKSTGYNWTLSLNDLPSEIVNLNNVYIFKGDYTKTDDNYVDWVFVRKYTANEPTITVEQIDDNTVKVTIYNNETTDLTDYQVAIPLSSLPDGFITSSTESLTVSDLPYVILPYWIEHDENGNPLNNVWIKGNWSGTKEFYVYYGSSDAPSYSNGDDVFEFFDDFDGTSLDTSKWTFGVDAGAPSYSISNSQITVTTDSSSGGHLESTTNFSVPFVVENRIKVLTNDSVDDWTEPFFNRYFDSGGNLDYNSIFYKYSGDVFVDDADDYSTPTVLFTFSINTWYINTIKYKWSGTDGEDALIYDSNRNLLGSMLNYDYFDGSSVTLWVLRELYGGSASMDWIFVRKYIANEPTITYGSEEVGSWEFGGYTYTKRKKVTVTSTTDLTDYQIALDYSQFNDDKLLVVEGEIGEEKKNRGLWNGFVS